MTAEHDISTIESEKLVKQTKKENEKSLLKQLADKTKSIFTVNRTVYTVAVLQNLIRAAIVIESTIHSKNQFALFYLAFIVTFISFVTVCGVYKCDISFIVFSIIANASICITVFSIGLSAICVILYWLLSQSFDLNQQTILYHTCISIAELVSTFITTLFLFYAFKESVFVKERKALLKSDEEREKRFVAKLSKELNEFTLDMQKANETKVFCFSYKHILDCALIGSIVFYAFTCSLAILKQNYITASLLYIVNGFNICYFIFARKLYFHVMACGLVYMMMNLMGLSMKSVLEMCSEEFAIIDGMPRYLSHIYVYGLALHLFNQIFTYYAIIRGMEEFLWGKDGLKTKTELLGNISE